MKLLTTFLISLLFAGSLAVYTKEDIIKDYNKIFAAKLITKGNEKVIQKSIAKMPETHYLSGLVNNNPRMVDYLVDNYASIDDSRLNEVVADPKALDKMYVEMLQKDSTFNKYFMQMIGHYLSSKNHSIKGQSFQKDTLHIDSLMNIASRFFHAEGVRPDGNISWKIGTGIGNMPQLQEIHRPVAEALAYTAIVLNYNSSGIKNDFMAGAGQVQGEQKVVIGQIDEPKLLAVRKGVNDYMAKSESLKKILTEEYEKRKVMVNFVIAQ